MITGQDIFDFLSKREHKITVFNIEPMSSPRPRFNRRSGSVYMPTEYVQWKKHLAMLALMHKFELPEVFGITFYMPIPSNDYVDRIGTPFRQKPDSDNLLKSVMDALKISDDQKCHCIIIRKIWAQKGSIEIRPIEQSKLDALFAT